MYVCMYVCMYFYFIYSWFSFQIISAFWIPTQNPISPLPPSVSQLSPSHLLVLLLPYTAALSLSRTRGCSFLILGHHLISELFCWRYLLAFMPEICSSTPAIFTFCLLIVSSISSMLLSRAGCILHFLWLSCLCFLCYLLHLRFSLLSLLL